MGKDAIIRQHVKDLLVRFAKIGRNGRAMANDNQKAGQDCTASAPADPIALALQRLHDEVTKEELPDSFLRVLDALDAGETSAATRHSPVSGLGT